MHLLVHTALRQYAIRRDDLTMICVIAGQDDLDRIGNRDRPAIPISLGELLDPHDHEAPIVHPIPALIAKQLRDTWAIGVIEVNQVLTILLDLRAIARSILAQRSIADR
jgi:hypothetical protein